MRPLCALIIALYFIVTSAPSAQAATFNIPAGDTAALINALNAAALQPNQLHVINLSPNSTYTLTQIDNTQILIDEEAGEFLGGGDQGLPMIISNVSINGHNAVIERMQDAPDFRIFLISREGKLTLNDLTVRGGRATDTDIERGNWGGAVFTLGSLILNESFLTENHADSAGGAINNWLGKVSMMRSQLTRNTSLCCGGGIYTTGELTIIEGMVAENAVGNLDEGLDGLGGGVFITTGAIRIENSSIVNNTAHGAIDWALGGGIYSVSGTDDGPIEISNNSTISGNQAGTGGGIYVSSGLISLRNVTIAENSAQQGGGVFGFTTEPVMQFTNTLLAHNNPFNCDSGLLYISVGNNIDSDGSCQFDRSTDLSDIDPLLGPLAHNGGPTLTHALLDGSPAINRANANKCPIRDQRGIRRGTACDIGSYEANANPTAPNLNSPANSTTVTNNRPTLRWNPNGSTRYQILLDTVNPPVFISGFSTGSTFTPPGPLLPRTFYWCVRGMNEIGQASPCDEIRSFTVKTSANAAPLPDQQAANTGELSWGRVSSATGYQVQVDNYPNFSSPEFDTVINNPATRSVSTTVLPNGVWYWRVRAQKADGQWGQWSSRGVFVINQP